MAAVGAPLPRVPPPPASPMLKEGLVPRKAQQSSATSKDRAYLGEKVGNGCSSQARHLAAYWSATQRQQLCLIYLFVVYFPNQRPSMALMLLF